MSTPGRSDAFILMRGMTVQHLRFRVRAQEHILFENEPGSALRGALYETLARNFCSEAFGFTGAPTLEHQKTCPVCWLLMAEDPASGRGQNLPRPLTLQPPLGKHSFRRGEMFTFGVSLVGKAQDFLPYVARAVQKMGEIGVGRGRGRFSLMTIDELHPLLDAERTLMDGNKVKRPTMQVTPAVIEQVAARLPANMVMLELLTPMRLTAGEKLVNRITPRIFMQRLLERCQSLAEHYAEYPPDDTPPVRSEWVSAQDRLLAAADRLSIGMDETIWEEAFSGSRRTGRISPIGGLIGRMRWDGDVAAVLPWLLWGVTLHVGKNAVKGSGYFRVIHPDLG
jgi:hypothetical protein